MGGGFSVGGPGVGGGFSVGGLGVVGFSLPDKVTAPHAKDPDVNSLHLRKQALCQQKSEIWPKNRASHGGADATI